MSTGCMGHVLFVVMRFETKAAKVDAGEGDHFDGDIKNAWQWT